jgi:hypothetical protein
MVGGPNPADGTNPVVGGLALLSAPTLLEGQTQPVAPTPLLEGRPNLLAPTLLLEGQM